ncbi:MAG TPA: efflux RND transporter periplasmic adaptor subunit [Phycisphaerae bacterium]
MRMASFLLLLAGTLAGSSARLSAQPAPPRVEIAQVTLREIPATLLLVATVQPARRSVIASEVAGLAIEVPVREGDTVQIGQLLCRLNGDTLALELAAAQSRLQALEARATELRNGTRPEDITRLKALYEEAKATLERWSFEMNRIRNLYGEQVAGQKEVYETQALVKGAEQQAEAAKAMYEMGCKGSRQEEIDRAVCEVAEQTSVVARLQRNLEKTEIRAPFGAIVARLSTEVGQWVTQGGPVVQIVDLSTVLVRVHVPESAVGFAVAGSPAQVLVDALGRTFDGTVKHVIPQADEAARTFPVDIEVANADGALKAGMFARATVIAGPAQPRLAVPKDAIVQRQGVNYVMIIQPGPSGTLAVPLPVELGASCETWIAIAAPGISENSSVVVRGNEGIYLPTPVTVAE